MVCEWVQAKWRTIPNLYVEVPSQQGILLAPQIYFNGSFVANCEWIFVVSDGLIGFGWFDLVWFD